MQWVTGMTFLLYPPETEEPDILYLHQQAPWKIVHAHGQKKKKIHIPSISSSMDFLNKMRCIKL